MPRLTTAQWIVLPPWQRRGNHLVGTALCRELEQALLEKALALSLQQNPHDAGTAAPMANGVSLQSRSSEEIDRWGWRCARCSWFCPAHGLMSLTAACFAKSLSHPSLDSSTCCDFM